MADLDPRTPVLVGVGQASERVDDPGYRRLSADWPRGFAAGLDAQLTWIEAWTGDEWGRTSGRKPVR